MPSLSEILKDKIGKGSKSKAYVASKLGISEKTVENYINGKRSPKPDRLVKLAELLEFQLSELSEQIVPKAEKGPVEAPKENQDISMQAIRNLTESGKELAEAQKIMVNNESRLIALLEKKSTADSSTDNDVASPKVMSGILLAMAKIASGTRWHSEDEALRALGRLVDEQVVGNKKGENIRADGGKMSTG